MKDLETSLPGTAYEIKLINILYGYTLELEKINDSLFSIIEQDDIIIAGLKETIQTRDKKIFALMELDIISSRLIVNKNIEIQFKDNEIKRHKKQKTWLVIGGGVLLLIAVLR